MTQQAKKPIERRIVRETEKALLVTVTSSAFSVARTIRRSIGFLACWVIDVSLFQAATIGLSTGGIIGPLGRLGHGKSAQFPCFLRARRHDRGRACERSETRP